jgi:hypothetical protein
MSFAFIPVPSENPLFNEKTVNEKWNKFMDKLCSDIITTLDLNPNNISKSEINDIITENLNKHYFIQSKSSTPTKSDILNKDSKSKKNSSNVSSSETEEEEKSTPIPTPTKTKTKTVVKKVIKKKVESDPEEESEVDEDSEKEEEIVKYKKEVKKIQKETKILKEESIKPDKERCTEILKNNSQCKGKAVLGSNLCSRHNKGK